MSQKFHILDNVHKSYVVATTKDWNVNLFNIKVGRLSGHWELLTRPEDLSLSRLREINPRYIFFPHWSWIVPSEILAEFECVCFHMADVPYGRGGSPLQNLISRGHKRTKLTALKMVEELDAGPVYGKLELELAGTAEEIFSCAAELCYEHISRIIADEPTPVPQEGDVVVFSRRRPCDSELPQSAELGKLYDHIRMLDAPTYPKAFIEYGDFVIEFARAEYALEEQIEANVTIRKKVD